MVRLHTDKRVDRKDKVSTKSFTQGYRRGDWSRRGGRSKNLINEEKGRVAVYLAFGRRACIIFTRDEGRAEGLLGCQVRERWKTGEIKRFVKQTSNRCITRWRVDANRRMSFLAAPNRVPLPDIPSVAFYLYHFSPSVSLFRAYILPFSRKSLRDLSKTARRFFSRGEIMSFATKGEDYTLTRFDNKRFFVKKGREEKKTAGRNFIFAILGVSSGKNCFRRSLEIFKNMRESILFRYFLSSLFFIVVR